MAANQGPPRASRRTFFAAESITTSKLNNMGRLAQEAAFSVLGSLVMSPSSTYIAGASGFVGSASFRPLLDSGLDVEIRPGIGVYNRPEMESIDPDATANIWSAMIVPLYLEEPETVTVGAHHATLPRIDLIYATDAEDADAASDIRVRAAGPGSSVADTQSTRSSIGVTLTVLAGTAGASPSPPAVPAGGLAIAHIYLPATAGTIQVVDVRNMVRLGAGWCDAPAFTNHGRDIVSSGLAVTAGSALTVDVSAGVAFIAGTRRLYVARDEFELADPVVNPVYELIYINSDGQLDREDGTPAGSPVKPSVPAGGTPLAYCYVAAGAVSITSNEITDARYYRPYTQDHIELPTVIPLIVIAASASNERVMTITAVDINGARIRQQVTYAIHSWANGAASFLTVLDTTANFDDGGAGSATAFGGDSATAFTSDAEGLLVVNIDTAAGGTVYVSVEPIHYFTATSGASVATMTQPTYIAGQKAVVIVTVT